MGASSGLRGPGGGASLGGDTGPGQEVSRCKAGRHLVVGRGEQGTSVAEAAGRRLRGQVGGLAGRWART